MGRQNQLKEDAHAYQDKHRAGENEDRPGGGDHRADGGNPGTGTTASCTRSDREGRGRDHQHFGNHRDHSQDRGLHPQLHACRERVPGRARQPYRVRHHLVQNVHQSVVGVQEGPARVRRDGGRDLREPGASVPVQPFQGRTGRVQAHHPGRARGVPHDELPEVLPHHHHRRPASSGVPFLAGNRRPHRRDRGQRVHLGPDRRVPGHEVHAGACHSQRIRPVGAHSQRHQGERR